MSQPTKSLLESRHLSYSIDGQEILKNVSFKLGRGEFVSLVGPSGCGKTTLLRLIAGLHQPGSGTLQFAFDRDRPIQVSMAFQKFPLFPWMSVLENVTICMNNDSKSRTEKEKTAMEFLSRGHLHQFASMLPSQLSGGMQQKVNTLRTFCSDSELILMDEPFVFLDSLQRQELQKFLLEMWSRDSKTIFFVTHNLVEALLLSDRILIMSGLPGPIVREFHINLGRPRDVDQIQNSAQFQNLHSEISKVLNHEVVSLQKKLEENLLHSYEK